MIEPSQAEPDANDYYAQTYDESVPDWPGEIDFYRRQVADLKASGGSVLELACGTGRVAIRLAQEGLHLVGLDLSPEMIRIARQKSAGLTNMRWFVGDMRDFNLGETFELVLIPGHAFQNLNTAQDQVACLESIHRHLVAGSRLIIHLDHMNIENIRWLGDLCGELRGEYEAQETFQHPETGNETRAFRAWLYEPATQTAIQQTFWQEMDPDGRVLRRIERDPVRLHCVFRFEMEHLLARSGFQVQALYGDFNQQDLGDNSPHMVWAAGV